MNDEGSKYDLYPIAEDSKTNTDSNSAVQWTKFKSGHGWPILFHEIQSDLDLYNQRHFAQRSKEMINKWPHYDVFLIALKQNIAIKLIIPLHNKQGDLFYGLFRGEVMDSTLDTVRTLSKEINVRFTIHDKHFGVAFNPWNSHLSIYPGILSKHI